MAFAKLYYKSWFKRNLPNMIRYYKDYLHEQWYNSLSEEDRIKVDNYRKQERLKNQMAVDRFLSMSAIVGAVTGNKQLYNSSCNLSDFLRED